MTYLPAPFIGRENLPGLFKQHGYRVGVEVGVHRGQFAEQILSGFSGTLYGVDHYPVHYHPDDPTAKGDREQDERLMTERLAKFGDRFIHIRKPSKHAAQQFSADEVDFVYIDGNHDEFWYDLRKWDSLVRKGGMVAGHDVLSPGPINWGKRIQCYMKHDAYLVPEDPGTIGWSFYYFKET